MTRLTPIFGSIKTMNITYATPRETLLGTPETLPTSEPTDPQIAYTVQSSDLPTFDIKPYSCIYLGRLLAGGQFVTAGTLYWRMVKNGLSVASSSFSVSANYYYVIEAGFLDVKVSDVLGLKLWSSVSDSNWDRSAIAVSPSRIQPLKTPLYKDVTIKAVSSQSFTNFSATASGTSGYVYIYNGTTSFDYANSSAGGFTLSNIPFFYCTIYGMFRTPFGDSTISNTIRNSIGSTRPTVYKFPIPSQFIFRGVFIDRHF